MQFSQLFDYIFPAVFVVFFGSFLFRLIRNGSLTGALLGARVTNTVGEIFLSKSQLSSHVLKVQTLEASAGEKPTIALSIVSKAPLGASMVPMKLTSDQAKELVGLLQQAIGSRGP